MLPTSAAIYVVTRHTVACNYLSTRVTNTRSLGRSKFKVSKFIHPLWNVLAPLCKTLHANQSQQRVRAVYLFAFLQIRMNDRKSIGDFCPISSICDLLQCAGELRKKHLNSVCVVSDRSRSSFFPSLEPYCSAKNA